MEKGNYACCDFVHSDYRDLAVSLIDLIDSLHTTAIRAIGIQKHVSFYPDYVFCAMQDTALVLQPQPIPCYVIEVFQSQPQKVDQVETQPCVSFCLFMDSLLTQQGVSFVDRLKRDADRFAILPSTKAIKSMIRLLKTSFRCFFKSACHDGRDLFLYW